MSPSWHSYLVINETICITSEVKLKAKFMLTRIRKGPVVDTLKVIWCTKQLKSADSWRRFIMSENAHKTWCLILYTSRCKF